MTDPATFMVTTHNGKVMIHITSQEPGEGSVEMLMSEDQALSLHHLLWGALLDLAIERGDYPTE